MFTIAGGIILAVLGLYVLETVILIIVRSR